MKETAKLETLIENVHTMAENYYDDTVPVCDMEFDSAESMWISGQHFEVQPSAQRLLANRLRVPYSYLSRCPEELQAKNLNYLLRLTIIGPINPKIKGQSIPHTPPSSF